MDDIHKIVADHNIQPEMVNTKLTLAEEFEATKNIAANPDAPPDTLVKLAGNRNVDVRISVATNPNTPPDTLTQLAEDEEWRVRWRVACNRFTSVEVLCKLTKDEDWWVNSSATKNPAFLQYRAEREGVCEVGVKMPVEWLKQMYLT